MTKVVKSEHDVSPAARGGAALMMAVCRHVAAAMMSRYRCVARLPSGGRIDVDRRSGITRVSDAMFG